MSFRFFYRVKRRRAAVASASLLGVATLMVSGLSAKAQVTLNTSLRHNARGAYDLLVTAPVALGRKGVQRSGLVETNFAALANSGSISNDSLKKMSGLSGVDVAAPLSFLGQLESPGYGVLVGAREPDGSTGGFFAIQPKAFDVSVRVTTTDGLEDHILSSTSTTVVAARSDKSAIFLTTPPPSDSNASDVSGDFTVVGVPQLSSGIVAVDPVPERRLLGSTGKFLAPLARFDKAQEDNAGNATLASLIPPSYSIERGDLAADPRAKPLPVVTSDSAYAPVRANVTVTPVDLSAIPASQLFAAGSPAVGPLAPPAAALVAAAPRRAPVVTSYDLTHRLAPFAQPYLSIALPGSPLPPGGSAETSDPQLVPRGVAPLALDARTSALPGAPVAGTANFHAIAQGAASLAASAQEQTYRPATQEGAPGAFAGAQLAPLGSYSPADVTKTTNRASYVPLGSYAPDTSTVVERSAYEGRILAPTFSGRGIDLPAPGAITSLRAAQAVDPGVRIDVVRVRVQGSGGYTPAVVRRVQQVAGEIAQLGLHVRVVTGSSLAPVNIYASDFFVDRGPSAASGADLGWIQQEWADLGAALQVKGANMSALLLFAWISVLTVSVLAAGVQWISIPSARREASLLRELGWARSRILRWFLAEYSVAQLPAVVGVIAALALGRGHALTTPVAVVAMAVVVAGTLSTAGASTTEGEQRFSGRPIATLHKPAGAVAGQVGRVLGRAERLPLVAVTFAFAIVVAGTGAFCLSFLQLRQASGLSRLALVVQQDAFSLQIALALVTAAAAIWLAGLAVARVRRSASSTVGMMVSLGWTEAAVSRFLRATTHGAAIAGVVLGALVAVVLVVASQSPARWLAAAAATTVGLVALGVITALTGRQARRMYRDANGQQQMSEG